MFAYVTAYGRLLNHALLQEVRQAKIHEQFRTDQAMQAWAAPQGEWVGYLGRPAHYYRRDPLFGEYWLTLISNGWANRLWLVLHNDGTDLLSGYRAVIERAPGQATYTAELFRGARSLARLTTPLTLHRDEDYTFRLRHQGTRVWLEVDGEEVLAAIDTAPPLSGGHPAFAKYGGQANPRDVQITTEYALDYMFTEAPTDWIGVGTWMPTVRWSCDPKWSFLGGWSRGDAVLWHKQVFTGDQALHAYMGVKMEYPRARQPYDQRFRTFGLTLCGDGRDPRQGYAVIHGAPDGTADNRRTVLLRNGEVVAAVPVPAMPFAHGGHNNWQELHLRKLGNRITVAVAGTPVLTYTDPAPLAGGIPAVWTSDNGLMLARVRIDFSQRPQHRAVSTVVLDEPWYPEWANVGRPLALTFPQPWSTTGSAVELRATAQLTPPQAQAKCTSQGTRIEITPDLPGEYWYRITATDGKVTSPPIHITLPVYTPSLARDDTHALVLYRFTEGRGPVVRDRSAVTPPLDLAIPETAQAQWVPGRGLWVRGQAPLRSQMPATKLMRLVERKACTIEAWVSSDTLCPPDDWLGCMLSWETGAQQSNLAILHQYLAGVTLISTLVIAPRGTGIKGPAAPQPLRLNGFQTGLNHYVITWDGQHTRAYRNGVLLGPAIRVAKTSKLANLYGEVLPTLEAPATPWHVEDWDANAHLLLGALSDGRHGFVGTYYLLAIHDTSFSEAQIRRQYQAGPDG